MEQWSTGMMAKSDGLIGQLSHLLQHSDTPLLQYSGNKLFLLLRYKQICYSHPYFF
jgi:hypothetical protein